MAAAPGNNNLSPDELAKRRDDAYRKVFDEQFVKNNQSPVLYMDFEHLSSPAAQRFYQRNFGFVSRIVQYEYQYRSWNGYDQALLDRYAGIINGKITAIKTLLSNWINRFNNIMLKEGLTLDSPVYPKALDLCVPITSYPSRQYFLLLKDLDELNIVAAKCAYLGVIDSHARAQAEFLCKKSIRAFEATLRQEVSKLAKEAKACLAREAAKVNGSRDTEREALVAQQSGVLDEMGKSMDAEGQQDRALNLDGADASKLIDDAAAATKVATAASARKRRDTAGASDAGVEAIVDGNGQSQMQIA